MRSAVKVIEANHVYKVFGRRPSDGVKKLKAGRTRDQLRKSGQTAAVIDTSFDVDKGEIFVVMGLSGSGKSTLIRMVNGLLPITAGSMTLYGEDLAHVSKTKLRELRRERVSMVFQNFALLPHRTVGENAAYGLEIQGVNRSERERRAEEALSLVGLEGWGGYKPGELSGGMRQRVGLARALAAETDILLMDEAFSALDPLIRREMQDQLIDLQGKLGKTILFITHDLNEAMRLGDRIAMMRDGRVEQVGTAEEILRDPASDYVSRFVADVDRTLHRGAPVRGPGFGPQPPRRPQAPAGEPAAVAARPEPRPHALRLCLGGRRRPGGQGGLRRAAAVHDPRDAGRVALDPRQRAVRPRRAARRPHRRRRRRRTNLRRHPARHPAGRHQ